MIFKTDKMKHLKIRIPECSTKASANKTVRTFKFFALPQLQT